MCFCCCKIDNQKSLNNYSILLVLQSPCYVVGNLSNLGAQDGLATHEYSWTFDGGFNRFKGLPSFSKASISSSSVIILPVCGSHHGSEQPVQSSLPARHDIQDLLLRALQSPTTYILQSEIVVFHRHKEYNITTECKQTNKRSKARSSGQTRDHLLKVACFCAQIRRGGP